ncbi:MAG TPA: tetratricopeptide repeat protein [Burkholderiales bacterium]
MVAIGNTDRRRAEPLLAGVAALMLAISVPVAADVAAGRAACDAHSYREALRLFRPLAEQGDVQAQYYLGRMYEKGQGVRKNAAQARKWYTRAAEGGTAPAQYRVAVAHACGLGGLERDRAAAVAWLQRSAEGGYKRAQRVLAGAYAEGRSGLPVDARRAEC